MHHRNKDAARLGSEGGNGSNRHPYDITTEARAQSRCTSMPSQGATTERRVVQLRLFTPDGAVIESLTSSARSGNGAVAKAVTEDDSAVSQQVNPTGISSDDVSGGAI